MMIEIIYLQKTLVVKTENSNYFHLSIIQTDLVTSWMYFTKSRVLLVKINLLVKLFL